MQRKDLDPACPTTINTVPSSPVDRYLPSVKPASILPAQPAPMRHLRNGSRSLTFYAIGATVLFCLTGLMMENGRLSLNVKLKDWLEINAEVDKTPPQSETLSPGTPGQQ